MYTLRLYILSLLIIFSGCSSSVDSIHTSGDKKISINTNSNSKLSLNIPDGWKKIDDNMEKLFEVWLVNSEYNSSISFIPINIDSELQVDKNIDKQTLVEKIILEQKSARAEDFEIISDIIEEGTLIKRRILYRINGQIQNSILFGNDSLFYECLAFFSENPNISDNEIDRTFEIQYDIVRNAEIK